MGAHLTGLALLYMPPDLSRPARLCLLAMCHSARDSGQRPGLYFGGWQALALALGYPTYDDAAERTVARALRELREAKLIERWDVSRGHRVAYRLLPYVPGKHHVTGLPRQG